VWQEVWEGEGEEDTADISKFPYLKNVPKKPENMSNFASIFLIQKIE